MMRKQIHISLLALCVINNVKKIRLELGLSQREVTRLLYPHSDSNLLGGIESNQRPDKYTDENLNKLAIAFTRIAGNNQKKLDDIPGNTTKIKTEYTIHDFYPPDPVPEKLVIKSVEEVSIDIQPTGGLNLLLEKKENDIFFRDWHTVKEITEFCNKKLKRNWKTTDFTSAIDRASQKGGKLRRFSDEVAKFKKA